MTVHTNQINLSVKDANGKGLKMSSPAGAVDAFTELRELMYEPDRGTWFSAVLTMSKLDEAHLDFNFDEDPEWWPSVPPTIFLADLEAFPRSEEHIRPWLREQLAEAEAEQEGEAAARQEYQHSQDEQQAR